MKINKHVFMIYKDKRDNDPSFIVLTLVGDVFEKNYYSSFSEYIEVTNGKNETNIEINEKFTSFYVVYTSLSREQLQEALCKYPNLKEEDNFDKFIETITSVNKENVE